MESTIFKTVSTTFTSGEALQLIWQDFKAVRKTPSQIVAAYRDSNPWPELDFIRREICICLIHDLHQAAIMLTNHYLEAILSSALIHWRTFELVRKPTSVGMSKSDDTLSSDLEHIREQLSTMSFEKQLLEAARVGIISKKDQNSIREMRTTIRNPYAHSNFHKIFGSATIRSVDDAPSDSATSPVHKIIDDPLAHVIGQWIVSATYSLGYFLQLDDISKRIVEKVSTIAP